ncbi:conserved hypothetical protein [Nostocoides japonicum T1-X7]|uniref:FAD-binding FR-type domain-containing protein n=1 Tax=Nostocoides japonicum T1-X7 TaxID=1194083 RepID=A0A077LYC3_9MICO|nr:siderophore-interacting protein [Tetrasphaera japonica]CCH77907.1 conserved hypothetical protein [Tetrasphaera japonica T1-X7]
MPPERRRRERRQAVLTVLAREDLTPHLVRVVLGGPGFADLGENEHTDRYVKILFADPALGLEPPYDMEALRERLDPAQLPVTRTYTLRSVDPQAQTVTIDFVVHGDEGLAGPWARAARPGDRIAVMGPGGGYAPDPDADRHFFAGDDTALPAIAAALEALPEEATGTAYLEVEGPADEIPLTGPGGVEIRWLHRAGATPGPDAPLARAVRAHDFGDGRVQVFAHGEREAIKALRAVFADRGIPRADLSLSGYWAYGRTEQVFQAEKREPIGQIFPD